MTREHLYSYTHQTHQNANTNHKILKKQDILLCLSVFPHEGVCFVLCVCVFPHTGVCCVVCVVSVCVCFHEQGCGVCCVCVCFHRQGCVVSLCVCVSTRRGVLVSHSLLSFLFGFFGLSVSVACSSLLKVDWRPVKPRDPLSPLPSTTVMSTLPPQCFTQALGIELCYPSVLGKHCTD